MSPIPLLSLLARQQPPTGSSSKPPSTAAAPTTIPVYGIVAIVLLPLVLIAGGILATFLIKRREKRRPSAPHKASSFRNLRSSPSLASGLSSYTRRSHSQSIRAHARTNTIPTNRQSHSRAASSVPPTPTLPVALAWPKTRDEEYAPRAAVDGTKKSQELYTMTSDFGQYQPPLPSPGLAYQSKVKRDNTTPLP